LCSAVGDMTTSKVPRCGEHTSERSSHGYNSVNHTNLAAGRCFASLALQLGLGILAERRSRIDSFDFNNSRSNGTPVNGARSADPPLAAIWEGVRSETSSPLKQLNDQDDNGNHEQEMN
jgi:hypothetical protein